jgi:hypothetical protein
VFFLTATATNKQPSVKDAAIQPRRLPMRHARRWVIVLVGLALGASAWAALTPISSTSRDVIFEIPKGTWARRVAGNKIEILPSKIRLTLGLKDVLVLKNMDDVPQVFGPTLMMPGQSFRLPFAVASDYQFACTAHASGQMTVSVEPMPETVWARIGWRLRAVKEQSWWR